MKSKTSNFFVISNYSVTMTVVIFLCSLFPTASAANFCWFGADGANWNVISNWSSTFTSFTAVTSLPTSADVVRINENSVTIPSGFEAEAKYIVVATTNEAEPSKIIVQPGGSLTCASNNGGKGACIYLRGGVIVNDGTITLNVTNTPSGYALTFENSTVAGVKTASSYSGNGVLKINASGQTGGGALKFSQTVASPVFTVNNNNNYIFNLATGRWPFTVQSGSNVIINGMGAVDFGTSSVPSVYGLFNFTGKDAALTVESGVTFNSKCTGTFGPDNGIINIGNFSGIKFTNKGNINMHTYGSTGIYCGSSTTGVANSILNAGTLTVDGGSAVIFGGSFSASITNTGTLSAVNVPSNSYSAGVHTTSVGPFVIKNTAPGIVNLTSGLGVSPQITDDFPTVNFVDPQTPANVKPLLVDNFLPDYSQSSNWDVVFSDEFNDTIIDFTKWNIENASRNRPEGLTVVSNDDQVEEKDGNANVYYRKSNEDPDKYFVGRFNSKEKYSTTYGYFECRMRIPRPEGLQIAFWMMPLNGMSPNGVFDGTANDGAEIDIIEACKLSNTYSSGLHWDGYGEFHKKAGGLIAAPGLHNGEYHTFGLEWSPTFLKFYYNGRVGRTITDPVAIPMVDEFIHLTGMVWAETGWVEMSVRDNAILNNGGTVVGAIDYVRVFKNRASYPPIGQLPDNFTENTIIMDNADATGVTIAGDWVTATNSQPYYKNNYLHDKNKGKGLKSVSYNPALNQSGQYEIYAYSPAETNRSTTTKYIIKRAEGDTTVLVDQTKNGDVWLSLGKYNLLNDNSPKVIISNAYTSGYVIADAVAFNPLTNTAIRDLTNSNHAVSVFSENKEIIVRFNGQPSGLVKIDIYNVNGILLKTQIYSDLKIEHQTVRLKHNFDKTPAMYFVKVSIDGKSVCKKVIF